MYSDMVLLQKDNSEFICKIVLTCVVIISKTTKDLTSNQQAEICRVFIFFFSSFSAIKLCFVFNVLNNKTVILLNLVEYPLILANSAYGLGAKYQAIFCLILQDNC